MRKATRARKPAKALEPFIEVLPELLAVAALRDLAARDAPAHMTINDLFAIAGLEPRGPVEWKTPVNEARAGIYVVALVADPAEAAPNTNVEPLSPAERKRWTAGQPVIYIGRATRSLKNRLAQFYRHKYGKKAPHRGGQAVIPLKCALWVYWATTDDSVGAEAAMIKAFRDRVGKLPYANRRR